MADETDKKKFNPFAYNPGDLPEALPPLTPEQFRKTNFPKGPVNPSVVTAVIEQAEITHVTPDNPSFVKATAGKKKIIIVTPRPKIKP